MANIITVPLPQDLPTNWVYGQTIGPQGTDVGLTQQHGYNYLMEQVNAAQQAAQELDNSVGNPEGIANLGANGQLPYSQTPHLTSDTYLYVDAVNGNDINPGTQPKPFKTIQAALNSLPKDLGGFRAQIIVAPGHYQGTITISGFYNGAHHRPVLIIGATDLLEADDYHIDAIFCFSCSVQVELQGVLISGENAGPDYGCSVVVGDSSLFLNQSKIKYDQNRPTVSGVLAIWTPSNVLLDNCEIDGFVSNGIGLGVSAGSIATVSRTSITNCTIGISLGYSGTKLSGIVLADESVTLSGNTINIAKYSTGSIITGIQEG